MQSSKYETLFKKGKKILPHLSGGMVLLSSRTFKPHRNQRKFVIFSSFRKFLKSIIMSRLETYAAIEFSDRQVGSMEKVSAIQRMWWRRLHEFVCTRLNACMTTCDCWCVRKTRRCCVHVLSLRYEWVRDFLSGIKDGVPHHHQAGYTSTSFSYSARLIRVEQSIVYYVHLYSTIERTVFQQRTNNVRRTFPFVCPFRCPVVYLC